MALYGEKSAATIIIHRPGQMTEEGRRAIATWMRRQAYFLQKYGDQYSDSRFRARYLYAEENVDVPPS